MYLFMLIYLDNSKPQNCFKKKEKKWTIHKFPKIILKIKTIELENSVLIILEDVQMDSVLRTKKAINSATADGFSICSAQEYLKKFKIIILFCKRKKLSSSNIKIDICLYFLIKTIITSKIYYGELSRISVFQPVLIRDIANQWNHFQIILSKFYFRAFK